MNSFKIQIIVLVRKSTDSCVRINFETPKNQVEIVQWVKENFPGWSIYEA